MSLNEFDIIAQFFTPRKKRSDTLLGVGDDCAIVQPPPNKSLVISTDTLNVGSHFLPETAAFDIGYKSVAVSLSDIAAMGAEPSWLLLSLTLPDVDKDWLTGFAQGLFTCLDLYNVDLIGGNTSKGPLSITTQILGFVDAKTCLRRDKAQPDDLIFVTGTLGDAAAALAILARNQDESLFLPEEISELMKHLLRPSPRVNVGQLINECAHAAIDISDGLIADLNHILDQSQVGATLFLPSLPLSTSVSKLPPLKRYDYALTGGDDYELCFTIPPKNLSLLTEISSRLDCKLTHIGKIETQLGLRIEQVDGTFLPINQSGYKHF